jgi:hypothetical protein
MASFEDVGRKIDAEMERLRKLWKEDVGPETERRAAGALRKVSEKLAAAAEEIEARMARREKK